MKGGGFRSTSSMNAFINTHSPSGRFSFQGIIKFNNTQQEIIIFVTPVRPESKGLFEGVAYNIQCSVDEFNYFDRLTKITSIPNFTDIEFREVPGREFKKHFSEMTDPPKLPTLFQPEPSERVPPFQPTSATRVPPFQPEPSARVPSPPFQPEPAFQSSPSSAFQPSPARVSPDVARAIDSSIVIGADTLLRNGFHPIFMKLNEEEFATILYEWIFSDEDKFLTEFAVPNICFWTSQLDRDNYLSHGEPLPTGLTYPFTPAMFLPLTPEKKTFLKRRPFRLRTLVVKTMKDRYEIAHAQLKYPKSYLPGYSFNYCAFAGNLPVGVPQNIYDLMIRSALTSCTLLQTIDARLISLDLYLNRHQPIQAAVVVNGLPSVRSEFHSDSGTPFSNPGGPPTPPQAELLTHAKIVSIMEPGTLSKSVSIMANISTTEDTVVQGQKAQSADESVKSAALEKIASGNYRNVITFISKNGTACLFDDTLIYHSSPWNDIPTTNTNVAQGLLQPSGAEEIAISGPTLLTKSLTEEMINEMKRDKQRCLFRVHYSDVAQLKHHYNLYPDKTEKHNFSDLIIRDVPIVITINRTPDGNVDLTQLNEEFGPTGQLKSSGLAMGGTPRRKRKRKTRKRKGGTLTPDILDENIIVTVRTECAPDCVIPGIIEN